MIYRTGGVRRGALVAGRLRVEWSLWSRHFGLSLDANGGDDDSTVTAHVGLGLFAVWLSLARLPIGRGEWRPFGSPAPDGRTGYYHHEGRSFQLYVRDWAIWFTPWGREMEWRARDPWWVRGVVLHMDSLILGRRRHTKDVLGPWRTVLVPMPEGCYEAQMRPEARTWKRPRWPWWPLTIRQEYIEIQIPKGIPFEGKGENDYDCGEDGLFGCSSSTHSYEKAIAHVVESVLTTRKRYGGSWQHREALPVMARAEAEAEAE